MYHKYPDLDAAGNLKEWTEEINKREGDQFDHVDTERAERSNFSISESAVVEKPKRKRGRPRKNKAEEASIETPVEIKRMHKEYVDKYLGVNKMKKATNSKLLEDLYVEKAQLSEKIIKLTTFINESIEDQVPKDQRALLGIQLSGMTTYYKALIARIKNLSED